MRVLGYLFSINCAGRDTIFRRHRRGRMMPEKKHLGQATPLSLLQRARANDQQAWDRLTALYRPLVLFWCRQAHCPAAEAEDVAQEVFAAVAAGLGGLRHDRPGDTFRGWLRA